MQLLCVKNKNKKTPNAMDTYKIHCNVHVFCWHGVKLHVDSARWDL